MKQTAHLTVALVRNTVWLCGAAMLMAVGPARAATINGNQDVSGGAAMTFTDTSGQTLTRNPSSVYDWNDVNGDGTTGDAISPGGLALGTTKIFTSNGTNITLSLNGGAITATGASTGTVGLATTRSGGGTGNITLTNVGNVTLGTIDTHTTINAPAGNISIGTSISDRAGTVSLGHLDSHNTDMGGGATVGSITIYSSGAVSITNGINMYGRWPGNITVDQQGGGFSSGVIDNRSTGSGGVTPTLSFNGGNKTGGFTATQILTSSGYYNSGAVTIKNYSGVSVLPAAGLKAIDASYGAFGTITATADAITVRDIGSGGVALGDLTTYYASYGSAGNVIITNVTGGGVSVGNINTANDFDHLAGNVTIAGVTGNVTVGSVDAHAANLSSNKGAGGSLRIGYTGADALSAIAGNIAITGSINLNCANFSSNNGIVKLATTGASTTITLGSLDLGKVQYAVVAPGSKCIVKGDLIGFSTNETTQTQLRMPAGKRMIYYPDLTNNAYLLRGRYVLARVDGTPAAGGVLMPYASPGTVVTFK